MFRAALMLFLIIMATPVSAWSVKEMNDTINSTNFIVGKGCSGTLISLEHRLILTNHHCITSSIRTVTRKVTGDNGVVSNVTKEDVRDLDVTQKSYMKHREVGKSVYKTEIIARWKESDLALLQVRAELINPVAAPVFSGDEVFRGEKVYAVGNPAGLDATVMTGVLSNVNRMYRVTWADGAEVPFLQTDAGITGGNSGGALFNDKGELIGVPAAAVPGTVLGLAIPFSNIQAFLTNNCYGEVWDVTAKSYEDCITGDEEGEDE